jgi:hypothetical protein
MWKRSHSMLQRLRPAALALLPWVAFAVLFAIGWRAWNLTRALPAYDDVLEIVWTTRWFAEALAGQHGVLLYPNLFYPAGWHVATYAGGPALLAVLLPLYWLGGAAFAYNVAVVLTFVVAFAGTRHMARMRLAPLAAVVVALLYTYWGFRWFRVAGHLNILMGSSLLPWLILCLDRALHSRHHSGRWWRLAGLLWGISVASSLYFLWIDGFVWAVWCGTSWLANQRLGFSERGRWLLTPLVALLISAPGLALFIHESSAAGVEFYPLSHITTWDASINAIWAPNPDNPLWRPVSTWLYRGAANEPGQVGLGVVTTLAAAVGAGIAFRKREWAPALVLGGLGVLLSLGLLLRWNGEPVRTPWPDILMTAAWGIGHVLKPALFLDPAPSAPIAGGVSLPGFWLIAVTPFLERARVFARFILPASLAIFPLAGLAVERIRSPFLKLALIAVLLTEILPAQTGNVPYPPAPHPAFTWLAQQDLGGRAVVDLDSWQPDLLFLPIGGNILLESDFHHQAALAGASSILPAHILRLSDWLSNHSHPFLSSEFVPLLRDFRVGLIMLHVSTPLSASALREAEQNTQLRRVSCFDPIPGDGPWPYPICVFAPIQP